MTTSNLKDLGLVRISSTAGPVGAGFVIDDRHIVTCAHVVNVALGLRPDATKRPSETDLQARMPVHVRVDRAWVPVTVSLAPAGWRPLRESRGDIAVLEMIGGLPDGARPVPVRRPHPTEEHRFETQGFPDGTLMGATGVIRARLTIGDEWIQLEDTKQTGRALTEGFSGAPIWDVTANAVVGMAIAKDAKAPEAKIAAMLPLPLLAEYWPPLADLLPSRLPEWDPRHAAWRPADAMR